RNGRTARPGRRSDGYRRSVFRNAPGSESVAQRWSEHDPAGSVRRAERSVPRPAPLPPPAITAFVAPHRRFSLNRLAVTHAELPPDGFLSFKSLSPVLAAPRRHAAALPLSYPVGIHGAGGAARYGMLQRPRNGSEDPGR